MKTTSMSDFRKLIVIAALLMTGFAADAIAQSSSSIVVRARGTAGGESITLRVNNTNVATWTLTTSLQNYNASTTLTGNVSVAFTPGVVAHPHDGSPLRGGATSCGSWQTNYSPSTVTRLRPLRLLR